MELGFETKGIRRMCERDASARNRLGVEAAAALQSRLADLQAAETITELPWLKIEFGINEDAAIEFHPGYWLRIMAIRGAVPMVGRQEIDWTIVDRIKIVEILVP